MTSDRNVVVIIQARMSSSRLPGKMTMDVGGQPLIVRTLERAKAIPGVETVVLATTCDDADRTLLQIATGQGVVPFAGSENDVLDRYYQAAMSVRADAVMRITGDCPLLDPSVSHQVLTRFLLGNVAYVSNIRPPTFPDGLDTELFTFEALQDAWKEATLRSDREHVTQFITRDSQRYPKANIANSTDLSGLRWTVDESEDLEFVRKVYEGLKRRGWTGHSFHQVIRVISEDGLQDASPLFERNEGQIKSLVDDGLDYAKEIERFNQ